MFEVLKSWADPETLFLRKERPHFLCLETASSKARKLVSYTHRQHRERDGLQASPPLLKLALAHTHTHIYIYIFVHRTSGPSFGLQI